MRIMALDPGGSTGVAYMEGDPDDWEITSVTLGPEEHHDALWQRLQDFHPPYLVVERFNYQRRDLTQGVTLNQDALEYIGVAKLWVEQNSGICDLILQQPAQRLFWTDDKLQRLELWKGRSKHERDAIRHLLYFMTKVKNWTVFLVGARG